MGLSKLGLFSFMRKSASKESLEKEARRQAAAKKASSAQLSLSSGRQLDIVPIRIEADRSIENKGQEDFSLSASSELNSEVEKTEALDGTPEKVFAADRNGVDVITAGLVEPAKDVMVETSSAGQMETKGSSSSAVSGPNCDLETRITVGTGTAVESEFGTLERASGKGSQDSLDDYQGSSAMDSGEYENPISVVNGRYGAQFYGSPNSISREASAYGQSGFKSDRPYKYEDGPDNPLPDHTSDPGVYFGGGSDQGDVVLCLQSEGNVDEKADRLSGSEAGEGVRWGVQLVRSKSAMALGTGEPGASGGENDGSSSVSHVLGGDNGSFQSAPVDWVQEGSLFEHKAKGSSDQQDTHHHRVFGVKVQQGGNESPASDTALVLASRPVTVLAGDGALPWLWLGKNLPANVAECLEELQGRHLAAEKLVTAGANGPQADGDNLGSGQVTSSALIPLASSGGRAGMNEESFKMTVTFDERGGNGSMARVLEWVNRIALEAPSPPEEEESQRLDSPSVEEQHSPTAGVVTSNLLSVNHPASAAAGNLGSDSGTLEASAAVAIANGSSVIDLDAAQAKRVLQGVSLSAVSLNLSACGLKVVPSFGTFHYLKSLYLSHNSIARLPAGVLPRSLHLLDLSHNRLTAIEGLRDLTRLRVLNLSHNRLSRIGHGLASCSSLRELYLVGNKIGEVEGLHRLLKLTVLDLSHNKLTSTKGLGQLAANYGSMQAFNLAGNPIHVNLGDDAFRRYIMGLLPHLVYLNNTAVKPVSAREAATDSVARASRTASRSSTRPTSRISTSSSVKKAGGASVSGHHRSHSLTNVNAQRVGASSTGLSGRSVSRPAPDKSERSRRRVAGGVGSLREEGSSSRHSSSSRSLGRHLGVTIPTRDVEKLMLPVQEGGDDTCGTPDLKMGSSLLRHSVARSSS